MTQSHMTMAGMGGPVGGQVNAGTPSNSNILEPKDMLKRLNSAIYDYLIRSAHYDVARVFVKHAEVETLDMKKSPGQRQNAHSQTNGVDAGGSNNTSMEVDCKEVRERPDDLPAPLNLGEGCFLQDWWCQFWEIHNGHRNRSKSNATPSYIGAQRQAQKARNSMMNMDPASMQNMRNYNGMMQGMGANGMAMSGDLKRAAMQNTRNLTPQQLAQMQNMQNAQKNAQLMQGQLMQGQQMERAGSQMDMSGPRSASPGSGDAPSPKRPRLEGNMQQMNQGGRPGPLGQMQANNAQVGPPSSSLPPNTPQPQAPLNFDPALLAQGQSLLQQYGIDTSEMSTQQLFSFAQLPADRQLKSVEAYAQGMQQTGKSTMTQQNSNRAAAQIYSNSVAQQQVLQSLAAGQGSPMSQPGMDGVTPEFLAAAAANARMSAMPPNGLVTAQQGANGQNALQDYQVQLMLLEHQNKRRLLMARQEQDNMHPGSAMGPNGHFAPGMSPQGSQAANPSPNALEIQAGVRGRGSPQPGVGGVNGMQLPPGMDPNLMPPNVRAQMMQNGIGGVQLPNGQQQQQPMMRPPSSHPMGQPVSQQQLEAFQRQHQAAQMQNGAWQGQPPPSAQMMPGQGQLQQGPPNMTPRQGNQPMPPPPVPAGNQGTQPSSPAQAPAPPTPSQTAKPKPGSKAEKKKNAAANKKGAANAAVIQTPASSEPNEAPPTPTPATPITPLHPMTLSGPGKPIVANAINNKALPNGQPLPTPNGVPPPAPSQLQATPQHAQPQQVSQAPQQDMSSGAPFGSIGDLGAGGGDQFANMNVDFSNLDGPDTLDQFDFDVFLNTTGDGDVGLAFDGDVGMAFDANLAFGDSGLEAGGEMGGN